MLYFLISLFFNFSSFNFLIFYNRDELTKSELSLLNSIEIREKEFRQLSRHNEMIMKKNDLLEDRGYNFDYYSNYYYHYYESIIYLIGIVLRKKQNHLNQQMKHLKQNLMKCQKIIYY